MAIQMYSIFNLSYYITLFCKMEYLIVEKMFFDTQNILKFNKFKIYLAEYLAISTNFIPF